MKIKLLAILLGAFAVVSNIQPTNAYFTDSATITGNIITAAYWETEPTPPPTPKPSSKGDVVINELMWTGSKSDPDDEWIELRNMKDSPIDISGWQLTYLSGTGNVEKLMLTIPPGSSIRANGYFLITKLTEAESAINVKPDLTDSHVTLRNGDLQIKLYKGDWTDSGNLIDTADDAHGTPLAGSTTETSRKSMERNDTPGDGTLAGSWHTCTEDGCNDGKYWKTANGNNYGTPGGANLSGESDQLNLNFYLEKNGTSVGFKIVGASLPAYDTLNYEITYDSDQGTQGITGIKEILGENEVSVDNQILGSCSTGGTCVYNSGVKNIHLKITLHGIDITVVPDKILEQEINF